MSASEATLTTTPAVAEAASASSAGDGGEAITDATAEPLTVKVKSGSAHEAAAGPKADVAVDFCPSRATNVSRGEDDDDGDDIDNDSVKEGDGIASAVAEEDGKPKRANNNDGGIHDEWADKVRPSEAAGAGDMKALKNSAVAEEEDKARLARQRRQRDKKRKQWHIAAKASQCWWSQCFERP